MFCEACGVKLTGMEEKCPECGTSISKDFLKILKEDRQVVGLGLVIDESGSMYNEERNVKNHVTEFIQEQQKLDDPATLTLVKFSGTIETVFDKVNLKSIETFDDYHPNGSTALNDGIGHMISLLSEYEKAIIAIVTDGAENSSVEFSTEQIKELIQQKEKDGWKFLFLAQGLNERKTMQMSKARGISSSKSFGHNQVGALYSSASLKAKSYRMSSRSNTYDDEL